MFAMDDHEFCLFVYTIIHRASRRRSTFKVSPSASWLCCSWLIVVSMATTMMMCHDVVAFGGDDESSLISQRVPFEMESKLGILSLLVDFCMTTKIRLCFRPVFACWSDAVQ